MDNRKIVVLVLSIIVGVLLILGATQLSSILTSSTPNSTGPSEGLNAIRIEPIDLNISENDHTELDLRITIRLESGSDPQRTFNDVFLCMYDSSGDQIASQNIGDFQAQYQVIDEWVNMSTIPVYTFVHHPDFRNLNGGYRILRYENETSPPWSTPSVNDLPFDHEEMGWTGCRPPGN